MKEVFKILMIISKVVTYLSRKVRLKLRAFISKIRIRL